MTIEEIFSGSASDETMMKALRQKTDPVRPWGGPAGLRNEWDPRRHPVMNRTYYPDIADGRDLVRVSRVALNFQRLACQRLSELVCGIPVKRVYRPQNDRQKEIAARLEAIFRRTRIDSVNTRRTRDLFACCEMFTLWYAVPQPNSIYGFPSSVKLRCRTFSPKEGHELYPFFDAEGDLRAISIAYSALESDRKVSYFETYTDTRHIRWSNADGNWTRETDEEMTLGKIPGVYFRRDTPAWEDTTPLVEEMEWSLSRNGNYLRENSKPRFVVYADEIISYGDEQRPEKEFKAVMQYPQGARAEYVTWPQAVENLRFYIETLRNVFFTQLQLPDWSYEKMSQQALSGESRKQMFVDAELKVKDEAGPLEEGFDREVNVVKAFLKTMVPADWHADVDALPVESEVTPYRISDRAEQVSILTAANGARPLMSQRESIEALGLSEDVDRTLAEIEAQEREDAFSLAD